MEILLILSLAIQTMASTLPSVNELSRANKCEQISIANCPELKYNQTMSELNGRMDINDAVEMVSFLMSFNLFPRACRRRHERKTRSMTAQ